MLKLITALFYKWMFAGTMFLAAGAVADVAGGGDGGRDSGASSDSAGEGDSAVSGDSSSESISSGDSSGGGGGAEDDASGERTSGDSASGSADGATDRPLPQPVRDLVTKLKAENPQLAKQVNAAFELGRSFYKEFPGGIKEARELKQIFSELGGKEAIPELQAEVSEWRDIDERWVKGDSSVIEDFARISPESFIKIFPAGLGKLQQLAPEVYQHTLAGIFGRTITDAGIENQLALATELVNLGLKEKAAEVIGRIGEWAKGIRELASKAPAKREAQPSDQREQDLQKREQGLFNRDLGTSLTAERDRMAAKELSAYLKGKTPTQAQAEAFNAELTRQLRTLIRAADQKFDQNTEAYASQRDKDGYMAYVKAAWQKHMALAVKRAYAYAFGEPKLGAKKPDAKPNADRAAAPNAKGWTKVAQRPSAQDIARGRGANQTTDEMILTQKCAILKNGQKVYWGDKVPA